MLVVTHHYPSFGLKHQLISGTHGKTPPLLVRENGLGVNSSGPPISPNKGGPRLNAIDNHAIERMTFLFSSIGDHNPYLITNRLD